MRSAPLPPVDDSSDSVELEEPLPPRPKNYYFEDGMVTFLVEGYLFKVHRHFLARDSAKFRAMMETSKDIIDLAGVCVKEFECLLDFFYEGMYRHYNPSLSDWVALLSISTRFDFQRVREHAITEIDSARFRCELGPVHKITLAEKYEIQDWLPPCYEALCQRDTGLEDSEAEALGAATTNRIWKAREAVRQDGSRRWEDSSLPLEKRTDWDIRPYDVTMVANIVKKVFPPPPVAPPPLVVPPSPVPDLSEAPSEVDAPSFWVPPPSISKKKKKATSKRPVIGGWGKE